MNIIFNPQTQTFHLQNQEVSYVLRVMKNGQLEHLYFGQRMNDRESFDHQHDKELRSHMVIGGEDYLDLSLEHTRQEISTYGRGDYKSPSLSLRKENGSIATNFVYKAHQIFEGKKEILPLPATFVDSDKEAATLEITLVDEVSETEIVLSYTIFKKYPIITRNLLIKQVGPEEICLEKIMSFNLDFLGKNFEMISLTGAWSRERHIVKRKLSYGIQSIGGMHGTAGGAEYNPFIALQQRGATEDYGEVYGFNLVYSGNFLAEVEVSNFDITRVCMGIHPEGFRWFLKSSESFQTPEVVMVYSNQGLNGMSQAFHSLYKNHLIPKPWNKLERPILLNNWEATYFDFTEEKIVEIATKAKEAGVELFVLDDGWFGERNDDLRGLGDWFVNLDKLPNGIAGLSQKIVDLGLEFGLWVELEMINKDSDLYRNHPDWIISTPGYFDSFARFQHVLDFSREEVVEYIYQMIRKILKESHISYIKWDMNRYMSEPYSMTKTAKEQGRMMHEYILGVYTLYTKLRQEFPHILFESCASGGARFDPGMLYFAPQAWTSDDTDAYERAKIQYGTSLVYPLMSMGSHVSAVPNHQVHRITPLTTRANMAYFGTFGYEMDLNLLTEDEFVMVQKQIQMMKKYRKLIQVEGQFYRINSLWEDNQTAWLVINEAKTKALVGLYRGLNEANMPWFRLKLKGLDKDKLYQVKYELMNQEQICYEAYGDELMWMGIPLESNVFNIQGGDFASLIFELEAIC